jgi:hypothetical protein
MVFLLKESFSYKMKSSSGSWNMTPHCPGEMRFLACTGTSIRFAETGCPGTFGSKISCWCEQIFPAQLSDI